jgi:hypothetical protein
VVIYRPDIVAKILIDNANIVMSWEFQVLGGPPTADEDDDDNDDSVMKRSEALVAFFSEWDGSCDKAQQKTQVGAKSESTSMIMQPTFQTRGKYALFCSVVLNDQYRNVQEGISVYSSWATLANTAQLYYDKIGEKDREGFIHLRKMSSE